MMKDPCTEIGWMHLNWPPARPPMPSTSCFLLQRAVRSRCIGAIHCSIIRSSPWSRFPGSTRKHYRLPTEAEWEHAARGGSEGALYPWGDAPPEQVPDYSQRWRSGPERVALYTASAFGLYNLGDNVHEWCADWYDA